MKTIFLLPTFHSNLISYSLGDAIDWKQFEDADVRVREDISYLLGDAIDWKPHIEIFLLFSLVDPLLARGGDRLEIY